MQGPKQFHAEIVMPALLDYKQNYLSFRHALAAVALGDMLMAHIFEALGGSAEKPLGASNDTDFRAELVKSDENIRLLRDIAKAQKHVTLVQGKPLVSKASSVSGSMPTFGVNTYGQGLFGGGFVVDLDDGRKIGLIAILDAALLSLKQEFLI